MRPQQSNQFRCQRKIKNSFCYTLVYDYRCLDWVKKISFAPLDLVFFTDSTDEEDHRMDWLKCVGIMTDRKGRFNYVKNVKFISMQMYVFIQCLQNWRIWHVITFKVEAIWFEFSFSLTPLFLVERLKDAVYPTINQWLCEEEKDSSLSQG